MISGVKIRTIFLVLAIYCLCGGLAYALRSASATDRQFDAIAAQATGGAESSAAPSIGREHTQKNRIARHLKGVSPPTRSTTSTARCSSQKFALANGGVHGRGPGNSEKAHAFPRILRLHIFHHSRGHRIHRRPRAAAPLPLPDRPCLSASWRRNARGRSPRCSSWDARCSSSLQALVHVAIVTGLAPVSGQPLPFISKGKTSILVVSAAIGVMLSVSRYGTTRGNKKQQNAEISQLPDDLQAANPMQIGS